MTKERRADRLGWVVALLLGLGTLFGGKVQAADTSAQADPLMGMTLEFDLNQILIERRRVLPDRIRDRIWEITPTPGRRLVAIPINIKSLPSEPVDLSQRLVSLRNSIFICFRVGDPDELVAEGSYDEEVQQSRLEPKVPRVTR